jgi:hypothetical protein
VNGCIYLLPAVLCFATLCSADQPQTATQYESLTGLRGTYNEKEHVFKVSFPRNDVKIYVDGTQLDPFMGLTSWVSFTPMDKTHFMVMGDLVLFQDEVTPVMTALLHRNIAVTALHNHFFYDEPKVYFMHIGGNGSLSDLARAVKEAMHVVEEIRSKNPSPPQTFEGPKIPSTSSIDPEPLEKIFGVKGQSKDGMVKFVFGRSVKMGRLDIGKDMGVNTWAAFAGNDENAIVDGDFGVRETELQSVLNILIQGNIDVVAIHHHMLMENPRMIFLHYWGKGNADDLAKTAKEALRTLK